MVEGVVDQVAARENGARGRSIRRSASSSSKPRYNSRGSVPKIDSGVPAGVKSVV